MLQFRVGTEKGAARVSELSPAEIYEREAERLYSMADAFAYYAVRDAFLRMARQYEVLARRATAAARRIDAAD